MSVVAKFTVQSYESSLYMRSRRTSDGKDWEKDEAGRYVQDRVEIRTVKLAPVGDSSPENRKFWDATPSGKIELSTINPEAWQEFEIGRTYYVTFEPAD